MPTLLPLNYHRETGLLHRHVVHETTILGEEAEVTYGLPQFVAFVPEILGDLGEKIALAKALYGSAKMVFSYSHGCLRCVVRLAYMAEETARGQCK